MARKFNERYVRYYTFGSTAAKLNRDERKAALPQYKSPEKRKPIAVDPVALVGNVVAIMLSVLMLVGMVQVAYTSAQVHELETKVACLEMEQELLRQKYESGYDLNEIRVAAESLGMVPAEEAVRIRVNVPAETAEVQTLSWWDSMILSLREFFA